MREKGPLCILVSYWFWKTQAAELREELSKFPVRPLVFCDSGAYSAASTGVTVDVESFARWYTENADLFDMVCTLDTGGPKGGYLNTVALQQMGLDDVIPVFHINEPDYVVDYYLDNYPMVAFGGMVPYTARQKAVARWLVRNLAKAQAKGVPVHALGNTNWRTLAGLPFYSADASSWAAGRRFAQAGLWDPDAARMVSITLGSNCKPQQVYALGDLLRHYRLDPDKVTAKDYAHMNETKGIDAYRDERWERDRACVNSQLEMGEWWRNRFTVPGVRGLPDGPHLFLVVLNTEELQMIRIMTAGDGNRPPQPTERATGRKKKESTSAATAPA